MVGMGKIKDIQFVPKFMINAQFRHDDGSMNIGKIILLDDVILEQPNPIHGQPAIVCYRKGK